MKDIQTAIDRAIDELAQNAETFSEQIETIHKEVLKLKKLATIISKSDIDISIELPDFALCYTRYYVTIHDGVPRILTSDQEGTEYLDFSKTINPSCELGRKILLSIFSILPNIFKDIQLKIGDKIFNLDKLMKRDI